MPPLQEIALDQLKIVRLEEVPVGSILQVADSAGSPAICLRSEMSVANGVVLGVVRLEGSEAGIFVTDEGSSLLLPVIDITAFVKILVVSPAPQRSSARPQQGHPGVIHQVKGASGLQFLGLPVFLSGSLAQEGFVHLDNPRLGVVEKATVQFIVGGAAVLPLEKSH